MNWAYLRSLPWLDTRARFVASTPHKGTLLDLGASDGETLHHFYELRPDLRLSATDIAEQPHNYPPGCEFQRLDLERDRLPWADHSMDAITCMHLVEHLQKLELLFAETARLLKPGGRAYFETPHPKSLTLPSLRDAPVSFTMNFYDDPTHIQPVPIETLTRQARTVGLQVERSGTSRNWLFAAVHPLFALLPPSRKKYTAQVHWLGWSAFLIVRKMA